MQRTQSSARGGDAIGMLIDEHNTIKGLLDELTGATDKKSRQQTLERLKAILTIHNAVEENLIYPALRVVGRKKAMAEHLYHETGEADVLVFELDSMLKEGNDAGFARKAQKFQDAVLDHIEDEEGKAFPSLEKGSDAKAKQMLSQAAREFRSKFRMSGEGDSRSETGEIERERVGSS